MRRRRPASAAELAATPLVSREGGSGTRDTLAAALGRPPSRPRLRCRCLTTAAVRGAVLAVAAPAVISQLAVAEDLTAGRLRQVAVPGLDLHRDLRVVWDGGKQPPPDLARDLIRHILSRHQPRQSQPGSS